MSPFIRGWKLQEIGEDTAEVAAILLRWVVSPIVIAWPAVHADATETAAIPRSLSLRTPS